MSDTPEFTKLYKESDTDTRHRLSLIADEIERKSYRETRDDLLMHFARWLDDKKLSRKAIREEIQRLIDKPIPE